MKKILALVFALVLIMATSVTALADGPELVNLNEGKNVEKQVSISLALSDNNFPEGYYVGISWSSQPGSYILGPGAIIWNPNELKYTIRHDSIETISDPRLSATVVNASTPGKDIDVEFKMLGGDADKWGEIISECTIEGTDISDGETAYIATVSAVTSASTDAQGAEGKIFGTADNVKNIQVGITIDQRKLEAELIRLAFEEGRVGTEEILTNTFVLTVTSASHEPN